LTAGDSLVVSGSLIKQGIAKSGNIVYQWKINGWDYDGSNGKTGSPAGWAGKELISGVISSGYAKCEVDFNGEVFSVDSSQKDGSWAQPCSSCLQVYGNSEKDYSVVATPSLGSTELSASSIKIAQTLSMIDEYDPLTSYLSELSSQPVSFPGLSCSSPGTWAVYLTTTLGNSADGQYERPYNKVYRGNSFSEGVAALFAEPAVRDTFSTVGRDAANEFLNNVDFQLAMDDARDYAKDLWARSSWKGRILIGTEVVLAVGALSVADVNYNNAGLLKKGLSFVAIPVGSYIDVAPYDDEGASIKFNAPVGNGRIMASVGYDYADGALSKWDIGYALKF
jgi:hypothetical protein